MLPRNERRRLEEIEDRLSAEDPDFVRKLTDPSATRWSLREVSPRVFLEIVAGSSAVLCLFLAEGAGFVTAGALATVLFAVRKYGLRVD